MKLSEKGIPPHKSGKKSTPTFRVTFQNGFQGGLGKRGVREVKFGNLDLKQDFRLTLAGGRSCGIWGNTGTSTRKGGRGDDP